MRRRVALYGISDDVLALLPLVEAHPNLSLARAFDPDPESRLVRLDGMSRGALEAVLTDDPAVFLSDPDLQVVVDAGLLPAFEARFPDAARRGLQILSPLTARLLWGGGDTSTDRRNELLQALHEIVESVNLTVDPDELFSRMLEIALGVTGADRGSLMLLDPESRVLRIRVAVGIEPELWPKIQVPLGEGIAGRVAAEGRPILVQGKAEADRFQIVRERLDVAAALCVPLIHDGRTLGVLSLSHANRPDAFGSEDLEFTERLGRLDAEIIAQAQEQESLRSQAARYTAVRAVQTVLDGRAPLPQRLQALCHCVAERAGNGIVTLYLHDAELSCLRVAASSLGEASFGPELRAELGQGLDGQAGSSREASFLYAADGSLAYAALPMIAGEQLLGVLSVQCGPSTTRPGAARETLLEIAAAAADEIAHADRETRLTVRATKVNALTETGIRMVSARDTTEVLRLATSAGAMVLEADHAVLRLKDESTSRYLIRSYFGSADGPLQEKLFRLDKRVSVEVIKRRAPLLVRDLRSESAWRELAPVARSILAAPLTRDGELLGTLCLYDKVAPDRLFPSAFGDEDRTIFLKFVTYVERAVTHSLYHAEVLAQRSFDEETGLPNARYLERRIDEEIARAREREGSLVVALCRLENLATIRQRSSENRAQQIIQRASNALQTHLRDFDVLGRTAVDTFTVLLPEPGAAPEERVYTLARSVADEIGKDDRLNDPVRVALAFGYAIHPLDGETRGALLARAAQPRIRML